MIGSCLGEGLGSSYKPRNRVDRRRNQDSAVMYADREGTLAPLSHHASNTAKTTPLTTMQHPTITSSPNDVDYCPLCLARSHLASTCLSLSDATRSRIINQRHINLKMLPPRHSYQPGNWSSRGSGKSTHPFRLENQTLMPNCRSIRNTHYPGVWSPETHLPRNRSLRKCDKTTSLTRTSVSVSWAAPPSAQTASIRPKH